jgi:hypothetical protein
MTTDHITLFSMGDSYPLELPLSVKRDLNDLVSFCGFNAFTTVFADEEEVVLEREGVLKLKNGKRQLSVLAKMKLDDYVVFLDDVLASLWKRAEYTRYFLYANRYVAKKAAAHQDAPAWAPRGAAFPLKVLDMRDGLSFLEIGANSFELAQRIIGTAFLYHLSFECVVVGTPRVCHPHRKPFIMFPCGRIKGVEWVVYATATDDLEQPYRLDCLLHMKTAHAMLTEFKRDYAVIGTLRTLAYPTCADPLRRDNMMLRADNPEHAVEKNERMQPVFESLNGFTLPPDLPLDVVWPVEERVDFLKSILNSSLREAKTDPSRFAIYWYPRYYKEKDEYVGILQGLLQLTTDGRKLPIAACVSLAGSNLKVVTLLTNLQARMDAVVYNPETNFGN